jgi:GST-like protein
MFQGPMSGQFGHFFVYAPDDKVETREYGTARYGMEVQRLCDVLDKALEGKTFLVGEEYTLADIMCYPWFDQMITGYPHKSGIKVTYIHAMLFLFPPCLISKCLTCFFRRPTSS